MCRYFILSLYFVVEIIITSDTRAGYRCRLTKFVKTEIIHVFADENVAIRRGRLIIIPGRFIIVPSVRIDPWTSRNVVIVLFLPYARDARAFKRLVNRRKGNYRRLRRVRGPK